jgi:hypothetical protein
MNAQDVIINAVAGAAVAFLGTIIISTFRSTKLLDDDRATQIAQLKQKKAAAEAQLASIQDRPTVTRLELSKRDLVRDKLKTHEPEDLGVLKYILQHGATDPFTLMNGARNGSIPEIPQNPEVVSAAIQRGVVSGLLKRVPVPGTSKEQLVVTSELAEALAFHLLGE